MCPGKTKLNCQSCLRVELYPKHENEQTRLSAKDRIINTLSYGNQKSQMQRLQQMCRLVLCSAHQPHLATESSDPLSGQVNAESQRLATVNNQRNAKTCELPGMWLNCCPVALCKSIQPPTTNQLRLCPRPLAAAVPSAGTCIARKRCFRSKRSSCCPTAPKQYFTLLFCFPFLLRLCYTFRNCSAFQEVFILQHFNWSGILKKR